MSESRERRVVAVAIGALLFAAPAAAQVVLDVKPTVKVESAEGGTTRTVLGEPARTEPRVTIVKKGERYFWTSREDRELLHHPSGAFHYFISPAGSGYIKVFDSHSLPASLRDGGPRFRYMEHVTLWLGTITYWGATDDFSLEGAGSRRSNAD